MFQNQNIATSHSDIEIPFHQPSEGLPEVSYFDTSISKKRTNDYIDLSVIINTEVFGIDKYSGNTPKKDMSSKINKVLRTHYSRNLVAIFDWLANNHSNDNPSIIHLTGILKIIKDYTKKAFIDPYSSYLLALYDGLGYGHTFKNLPQTSFKEIAILTKKLNNQELKGYSKVDKAIAKLENLGINTLPY